MWLLLYLKNQNKFTYSRLTIKSLQSLRSHLFRSYFLFSYCLKNLRDSLSFLFCRNHTCQNLKAKNLKEFRPYLLLLTEFMKKLVCVRKLYFNVLDKNAIHYLITEIFSYFQYQIWMFLWWIVKGRSSWSNLWKALVLSLYIQFLVGARVHMFI